MNNKHSPALPLFTVPTFFCFFLFCFSTTYLLLLEAPGVSECLGSSQECYVPLLHYGTRQVSGMYVPQAWVVPTGAPYPGPMALVWLSWAQFSSSPPKWPSARVVCLGFTSCRDSSRLQLAPGPGSCLGICSTGPLRLDSWLSQAHFFSGSVRLVVIQRFTVRTWSIDISSLFSATYRHSWTQQPHPQCL